MLRKLQSQPVLVAFIVVFQVTVANITFFSSNVMAHGKGSLHRPILQFLNIALVSFPERVFEHYFHWQFRLSPNAFHRSRSRSNKSEQVANISSLTLSTSSFLLRPTECSKGKAHGLSKLGIICKEWRCFWTMCFLEICSCYWINDLKHQIVTQQCFSSTAHPDGGDIKRS